MNNRVRTIAILTHSRAGGVWSVTRFLWKILNEDSRFRPDIFFLATSARDAASVRLAAPNTWLRGVQVRSGHIDGIQIQHVGAFLSELEFQRYRPRKILTEILNEYDLVQVVAGTPAWAAVTERVERPVCLFTATTIFEERKTVIDSMNGWHKWWIKWMTFENARIEQQILPKLDVVFAESVYTKRALESFVTADRLRLGPPGVDTSFFTPATTQANGYPYILSVGRFSDPRKNVRLLFEAYAIMRGKTITPPRLVLAGRTPPTYVDMQYAEELGITKDLIVQQNVSMEELAQLYRNALVFVLSSDEEGLGIVILEAMASGIPVVSTDCGGPSMAIQNGVTGFLTPVGCADELATSILQLIENDDLRRQMGRVARRVSVERFSLEATSRVYLNAYEELLFS